MYFGKRTQRDCVRSVGWVKKGVCGRRWCHGMNEDNLNIHRRCALVPCDSPTPTRLARWLLQCRHIWAGRYCTADTRCHPKLKIAGYIIISKTIKHKTAGFAVSPHTRVNAPATVGCDGLNGQKRGILQMHQCKLSTLWQWAAKPLNLEESRWIFFILI